MLGWFDLVYKDLCANRLCLDFYFSKKGFCIIILNGESTGWQDVYLSSHWVMGKTIYECSIKWLKIIEILASRSLLIMFKNRVSDEFNKKLSARDFNYLDNVAY